MKHEQIVRFVSVVYEEYCNILKLTCRIVAVEGLHLDCLSHSHAKKLPSASAGHDNMSRTICTDESSQWTTISAQLHSDAIWLHGGNVFFNFYFIYEEWSLLGYYTLWLSFS
jgi:hypothetical protein